MIAKFLLIGLSSALLFGCQSNSHFVPNSGTWQVSELNGTILTEHNPTIRFSEDGRISGFSGCNRYSAGLVETEAQIYITEAASTKMLCIDSEMAIEQQFLSTLPKIIGAQQEGDAIRLIGHHGELMRLTPLDN